jgi:hypothetical protein
MKKLMTAAFALSALFAASGKAHAEVNYPWCLMGDTRGYECVFSCREQCAQDGRNRGFGSQCIQNPAYKPGKATTSQTARPSQQTARTAHQSAVTCTGIKSSCYTCNVRGDLRINGGYAPPFDLKTANEAGRPGCERYCNFTWERCMKTGWWEGIFFSAPAERR